MTVTKNGAKASKGASGVAERALEFGADRE